LNSELVEREKEAVKEVTKKPKPPRQDVKKDDVERAVVESAKAPELPMMPIPQLAPVKVTDDVKTPSADKVAPLMPLFTFSSLPITSLIKSVNLDVKIPKAFTYKVTVPPLRFLPNVKIPSVTFIDFISFPKPFIAKPTIPLFTFTHPVTVTGAKIKDEYMMKVKPAQPIEMKKAPETSVESVRVGKVATGEPGEAKPESEVEDVLSELLPPLKGSWKMFDPQRPLCLIVVGKSSDGLAVIEDLMATMYLYRGKYGFFMGLPWQRELSKIVEEELKKTGVKHTPSTRVVEGEEKPYQLITSEKLIVRIFPVESDLMDIVRGLREISRRGPKCVIMYTSNADPFENLDKKVVGVDVKIVALPEFSEKLPKLIGKLLGVDLPPEICGGSLDELWGSAVRLYEEEMHSLNDKLPTKGVKYLPEEESEFHYLMKRIVYHYLKENGYTNIETEVLIEREEGQVKPICVDIVADGEYWEVETGYPSREEMDLLREPWKPQARLIWKLSRYGEVDKIHVVLPAIYAHLFKHEVKMVREYFKEKRIDVKFHMIHLSQDGKVGLKRFL
jgi:hypothetical protein